MFVAIISGRAIESAKSKVDIGNVIFAGNHGYEIQFPDGFVFNYQFTENMQENFKKMVFDLNAVSFFLLIYIDLPRYTF